MIATTIEIGGVDFSSHCSAVTVSMSKADMSPIEWLEKDYDTWELVPGCRYNPPGLTTWVVNQVGGGRLGLQHSYNRPMFQVLEYTGPTPISTYVWSANDPGEHS